MISSMTGFAKSSVSENGFSAEIELRSINSRYLEFYLKIPSHLSSKEFELKELIRSKIKRGKISLIISLKRDETASIPLSIDSVALSNYILLLNELKKSAGLKDEITLNHLLDHSDVFILNQNEFSENEFQLIKKGIEQALTSLIEMKRNEGNELEKDLRKRISIIDNEIDLIEKDARSNVVEHFEKYKERAKQLLKDLQAYSERIDLELALLVEKSDITEECVRLRSHTKFFIECLEKEDEPGRKLNFLCQEMNREANTISSKSLSTVTTYNAVLIKEEIEKIREQIQNIE